MCFGGYCNGGYEYDQGYNCNYGGYSGGYSSGGYGTYAIILVLFILLVIISCTICK